MKKTTLALSVLFLSSAVFAGEFSGTAAADSGFWTNIALGVFIAVCVVFAILLLLGLRQIRKTFIR
jgi:hypothetical protein